MDEARRVIDRLERIDALRSTGAAPRAILGELRELVRDGQAWLGAEGPGLGAAGAALGALDQALGEGPPPARERTEEVVLTDSGI